MAGSPVSGKYELTALVCHICDEDDVDDLPAEGGGRSTPAGSLSPGTKQVPAGHLVALVRIQAPYITGTEGMLTEDAKANAGGGMMALSPAASRLLSLASSAKGLELPDSLDDVFEALALSTSMGCGAENDRDDISNTNKMSQAGCTGADTQQGWAADEAVETNGASANDAVDQDQTQQSQAADSGHAADQAEHTEQNGIGHQHPGSPTTQQQQQQLSHQHSSSKPPLGMSSHTTAISTRRGSAPLDAPALHRAGSSTSGTGSTDLTWVVFNDFCLTPIAASEVLNWYGNQKLPCLLFYTEVSVERQGAQLGCHYHYQICLLEFFNMVDVVVAKSHG